MKRFNGTLLADFSESCPKEMNYCVIEEISDFKEGCQCIISEKLSPDFTILLGKIRVIIAERGSVLSHLALIAREYKKQVVLVKDITGKIPKKGLLRLEYGSKNAKVIIL